jgi:hypothetical protein
MVGVCSVSCSSTLPSETLCASIAGRFVFVSKVINNSVHKTASAYVYICRSLSRLSCLLLPAA